MKELITPFFGKERYNVVPDFQIILQSILLIKRLMYIFRVYLFIKKCSVFTKLSNEI